MNSLTTKNEIFSDSLSEEYPNISRLAFSTNVENAFKTYRRESFLKINHSLLLIASIIYITFIFSDYAVTPADFFPYISGTRVIIAVVIFACYFLVKHNSITWFRERVFIVLAGLILLICLHVCVSAYIMPPPYSEIFMLGILQLYIVVPAILKPHSKVCLVTMLSMLVMVVCAMSFAHKAPLETNSQIINDLMLGFPISFTLFLAGLIFLSAYTAYSYEKMLRQNWLDNQLTQIKSQHLEELSEQFRALSHKDELTQLPNRRSFQSQLDKELKAAYRSVEPFSLVMIDVDYFKAFNDNYGHQAGDDCLRRVAQSINDTCQRKVDMPARYGGEEFMVILPNTNSEGAHYLAERIRENIQTLKIPHTESNTGVVTASLGVVTVYGSKLADVDSLIKQVDDALYLAKEKGRNCTVVSHQSVRQANNLIA